MEPQGFGSVCIFCVHIVFTIILTKLPLDRVPVIRYTAVMPSKIFTRVGFPLIAISFCCVVSTLKFNPGVILVVVFTSDRISPGCLYLSYDFVCFHASLVSGETLYVDVLRTAYTLDMILEEVKTSGFGPFSLLYCHTMHDTGSVALGPLLFFPWG